MQRPITDFGIDDLGDPFAVLSCGHTQHVRHQPPFTNRPWVATEAGRRSKLGELRNCDRCDRREMPDGLTCYRRTPIFDPTSVPAAFLRAHSTKAGVWARIVVEHGVVRYHVDGADEPVRLSVGTPGIVPPQVPHRVELCDEARFLLEFWRAAPDSERA